MTSDPAVWVLHDGEAGQGRRPQAVGLAEADSVSMISEAVPDDAACAGAALRAPVSRR
jgi:hypothetical protein